MRAAATSCSGFGAAAPTAESIVQMPVAYSLTRVAERAGARASVW